MGTSLSWQESDPQSNPALSPLSSSDKGRQEQGQQWPVGHKGYELWRESAGSPNTHFSHTRSSVRRACGTHGCQLSLLSLPCPGGGAAGGTCLAQSWQHEGPGAPLQPPHEGLSETGERLRSAVALTCQGRLENRVLSPPHRCIQFLSVFITPSCTGPASRAGGRSQGGLGIYFLE